MAVLILLYLGLSSGFSIPGIVPRDYSEGYKIDILVNHLDSSETQLAFDYYYLNYCKPEGVSSVSSDTLGQILAGDRREKSSYYIEMNIEKECVQVCSKKNNNKEQIANFVWMIDNLYYASWILDNLPSGYRQTALINRVPYRVSIYQDGFPIGYRKRGEYFIYNHANIFVKVYFTGEAWRIVGFLVEPLSLSNESGLKCESKQFAQYLKLSKSFQEKIVAPDDTENLIQINEAQEFPAQKLGKEIIYTYSTLFEESNIKWASRWDMYLYGAGKKNDIHWLAIINSFALVLFLSGMIAHILCRTIRKDITNYNEKLGIIETGWKQIKGEVFRKPACPGLFCMVIGSGVQLICTAMFSLSFWCMGFLSPVYRGEFISISLIVHAALSFLTGYTSARLYKMFELKNWKLNALGSSLLFPSVCLCIFSVINTSIMTEESSGTVPFDTLAYLLAAWLGFSISLVFLGAGLGVNESKIQSPCDINKIPRPITAPRTWKSHVLYILAGSLPFGSMFIELSYMMKTMWHHTLFYYLFGFLFLCFIVLMVTSAEVSILMTYMLLCNEDYRWWWVSFEVSGSSGLYFFMYSLAYYYSELNFSRLSSFVFYFGYMFLASITYSLITGTIGFIATFVFIRIIYSLIKSD
jgi:transmembrane 9 superfamily member 2/4